MCFSLSSLVVAVLEFPAGDVDIVELLAVHLLENQKPEMYKGEKGEVDEGDVIYLSLI